MLNIGLVGCGFIGQKHIRSMVQLPLLQLHSVCDTILPNMELVSKMWRQLRGDSSEPIQFSSYEKMLDEDDLDAIVLCVPSGYHARMAIEALKRGKHVIVEKPMTLSTTDAREMLQLARNKGLSVMVCHQKRFVPHLTIVKDMIQRGKLGQVVYSGVKLLYNRNDAYYASSSWRGTWEKDGGVLMNQAIHDLDLLCWLVDEPVKVNAQVNRLIRPMEAEDSVVATFQMKNGSLSSFVATVCAHPVDGDESITIIGTEGAIVLSGKLFEKVAYWHVSGELPPFYASTDLYSALYQDFIESVRNGKIPAVSAEDGYRTIQVAMAIYQAALSGRTVTLPIGDFDTSMMQGVFSSVTGGDETSVQR